MPLHVMSQLLVERQVMTQMKMFAAAFSWTRPAEGVADATTHGSCEQGA